MSGKAKQANRTKNNVRPSSSGRSAELLTNKVNPALVLVGPGNLLPAVFPSLAGPTADQPLSNEFLLCFKKFHKKDPITKIKALNELKDLVAKSEQNEVVNALGSWAHYYPSLTVDIDRKVREATQTCHGAIVRKCGRQVALHIKRLLPAWLMAQHDEHGPVQRIAQADLQATFPNTKLVDAIKFCKVEICNLYMDNLKGNADYMLSGRKIEDEEEREAQLARVVSSTLRALELLIGTLPDAHAAWLWDTLLPLLCANSYWKLAGHGSPAVRASFYLVTGAALSRFQARLPAELARRGARALLAHAERVPAASAQRWRTLLVLMFTVQDFLDFVDNKDLLVKRLWDAFENAAWGEARRLADVLLPLLELLPAAVRTEDFYNKFFEALLAGLRQKSLLSDEGEREVWCGMIAAALRYVSAAHAPAPAARALVRRAHRAWLRAALGADCPAQPALLAATAARMADVVAHWAELDDPVFEGMTADFWENVGSATATDPRKPPPDPEEVVKLTAAHVQLVIELERSVAEDTEARPPGLTRAAEALIGSVLQLAHAHRLVRKLLPVTMPLVREFPGADVFRGVGGKFGVESVFELYARVLKAWLLDDGQRCETVVELAFLLLPHLEDDDQDALFDSFEEMTEDTVRWCLALALRARRAGAAEAGASAAAARWLRSAAAERALVALVRLHEEAPARHLLLAALTHQRDDDVIVSDEAIGGIVSACTELLDSLIGLDAAGAAVRGRAAGGRDPFEPLEPRAQFAARLVHALSAARASAALPLMVSLFRLTLHVPRGSPLLAVEAWTEALGAWRLAARRLPRAARSAFVRDALRYLHRHLFDDVEKLDVERIDHVVALCPYFVVGGDGERAPADPAELEAHSRLLLQPERAPAPPLEVFALQMDVVWGDLACPFERDNEWVAAVAAGEARLSRRTFVAHAARALFRATYVREILLRPGAAAAWCDALIRLDYFRDQFCELLHDYAILSVLHDHYAFWEHYDAICEAKERMSAIVVDMVAEIPADAHVALTATLEELALAHGYYWAYAKRHYGRAVLAVRRAGPGGRGDGPPASAPASDEPERADSQQSHSSCSFEMVDAVDTVDDGAAGGVARTPCGCHELHSSTEEVFLPLLIGKRKTERESRSPLSRAAKPVAALASDCEQAARYVDLLGDMVLESGYFHEAQMKAAEVKKLKLLAKAKFDQLQDTVLEDFEVNGQYRIFEKWGDEPAAYRQVGVDVDEHVLYTAKDFAMLRAYYCLYAERAPHVDELIADLAAEGPRCNLDAVINGYYRHNDTMLFERSLQGATWLELSSAAAVLDLLCEAVTARGWDASALHWDFANIALCSSLTSLALSASMWADDAVRLALVARPALELYVRVRRFIGGVRRECTRRQPSAHVAALPREWADIFAPDATANLLLLACHVLDASSPSVTAAQVAVLSGLIEAAKLLEASAVPIAPGAGRVPLERAVRSATRALADTCHHGFKYLAYYTLRSLAPALIRTDEARLAARVATPDDAATNDDEAVFSDLTLELYDEDLDQLQELVDAALSSYVMCDDICEVMPHSDSHSVVLGYLLLCVALHRHCELATGDLALHYGTVFNAHAYVEGILPAALRLLPPAVVHYMAARVPTLPKRFLPWFIRLQDFDLNEACSGSAVSRLACGAVLRALGGPGGAAARGWWAVQRARDAAALARLVTAAVAPPLVNHQLAEAQERARHLRPPAKVTVYWSERAATCEPRGEAEDGLALRVVLSAAHPLHAPRVLSAQPSPDPQWLARYLGWGGGRVLAAMQMWLEAVTAELRDGVHCYVCYCRAHPQDAASPTSHCRQCRNTFHPRCLRQWFKMSNRSHCPVCRTGF